MFNLEAGEDDGTLDQTVCASGSPQKNLSEPVEEEQEERNGQKRFEMEPNTTPTRTPALNRGQSHSLTSVMLQHKLVTLRKVTAISKPCSL